MYYPVQEIHFCQPFEIHIGGFKIQNILEVLKSLSQNKLTETYNEVALHFLFLLCDGDGASDATACSICVTEIYF